MGKPSIFSRDYEQRMKRRRLNLILFILLIISAAFFGGKYYLNNKNIDLFKGRDPLKFIENKVEKQKNNKQNVSNATPKGQSNNPQKNQSKTTNISSFDYKTLTGKIYKIQYTISNGVKQITNLIEDTKTVQFDISQDRQKIVFEDKDSGYIMLWDVNGRLLRISRDSYKTKSTGKVLTMESVTRANPWFIWAQKPHFTTDGRVVYISHLPYIKVNGNLYVWSVNLDGSGHTKLGQLSNQDKDIKKISYAGFDSTGNLMIKSQGRIYYVNKGSYELKSLVK